MCPRRSACTCLDTVDWIFCGVWVPRSDAIKAVVPAADNARVSPSWRRKECFVLSMKCSCAALTACETSSAKGSNAQHRILLLVHQEQMIALCFLKLRAHDGERCPPSRLGRYGGAKVSSELNAMIVQMLNCTFSPSKCFQNSVIVVSVSEQRPVSHSEAGFVDFIIGTLEVFKSLKNYSNSTIGFL